MIYSAVQADIQNSPLFVLLPFKITSINEVICHWLGCILQTARVSGDREINIYEVTGWHMSWMAHHDQFCCVSVCVCLHILVFRVCWCVSATVLYLFVYVCFRVLRDSSWAGLALEWQCVSLPVFRCPGAVCLGRVLYYGHVVIWISLKPPWRDGLMHYTKGMWDDFQEEAIRLQNLIVKAGSFRHSAEQ